MFLWSRFRLCIFGRDAAEVTHHIKRPCFLLIPTCNLWGDWDYVNIPFLISFSLTSCSIHSWFAFSCFCVFWWAFHWKKSSSFYSSIDLSVWSHGFIFYSMSCSMCFFVAAQIVTDLVGGSLFKLQTVSFSSCILLLGPHPLWVLLNFWQDICLLEIIFLLVWKKCFLPP